MYYFDDVKERKNVIIKHLLIMVSIRHCDRSFSSNCLIDWFLQTVCDRSMSLFLPFSYQFHASIEGKLPTYNTRIKLPQTQRDLVYGDGQYHYISLFFSNYRINMIKQVDYFPSFRSDMPSSSFLSDRSMISYDAWKFTSSWTYFC